jgi:hypothetical protein
MAGEHPVEFGKNEGWVDFELKLVGMSKIVIMPRIFQEKQFID